MEYLALYPQLNLASSQSCEQPMAVTCVCKSHLDLSHVERVESLSSDLTVELWPAVLRWEEPV